MERFDVGLRLDLVAAEKVAAAWRLGELPMVNPVGMRLNPICTYCGKVQLVTDGLNIRADVPCKFPNGLALEVELNVPSGRLIVTDDLRPYFDVAGCRVDYHFENVKY